MTRGPRPNSRARACSRSVAAGRMPGIVLPPDRVGEPPDEREVVAACRRRSSRRGCWSSRVMAVAHGTVPAARTIGTIGTIRYDRAAGRPGAGPCVIMQRRRAAPVLASLPRAAWAIVAAIVAFAWFAALDLRKLQHPDEGRYAEIAREMACQRRLGHAAAERHQVLREAAAAVLGHRRVVPDVRDRPVDGASRAGGRGIRDDPRRRLHGGGPRRRDRRRVRRARARRLRLAHGHGAFRHARRAAQLPARLRAVLVPARQPRRPAARARASVDARRVGRDRARDAHQGARRAGDPRGDARPLLARHARRRPVAAPPPRQRPRALPRDRRAVVRRGVDARIRASPSSSSFTSTSRASSPPSTGARARGGISCRSSRRA